MKTWTRRCLAGVLVELAALAVAPAWAAGAMQAVASTACGIHAGTDIAGPGATNYVLSCDESSTFVRPPFGDWEAASDVKTTYRMSGEGMGTGSVDSSSSVTTQNPDGSYHDAVQASASGSVRYWVAFPLKNAPLFVPPMIAITFSARGETHASGQDSGSGGVGAWLSVANFPIDQFQRNWSGAGEESLSFDAGVTVWVDPTSAYQAFVNAACSVWRNSPGHAECQSVADPTIAFDQAAFDARYGASSFDLASTYRMEFSAPVPEAAMVWQWFAGLLVLAAARHARRSAR